jgi:hypothetical protein
MTPLFLLNFPAILFSFLLTLIFFSYLDTLERILCAALWYFVYIVVLEQTLGLFNILTLGNLYFINVLVLLALLLDIRIRKFSFSKKSDVFEALKIFPGNKFVLFFIAAITGFSLVKISLNLVNAPFGWDSLNYHFTFAVEWLKHANLDTPIVISDNPCPTYFPINGSLIYLWFMFPFKSVMLADLGQIPFFAMVFLSIYNLCRKMDVSQEYSFFAAALFTVTPNYFKQMNIAYVDIMVCAWFLLALNFLFNLNKDTSIKNTLLFALSIGMLIGTKTIALNFSFILIFFFIYILLRKKPVLNSAFLLLIFLAAVVITGSFSYIRNFAETGNPLYPLDFQAGGRVIFKGVLDKANFTAFSNPQDYSLGKILFHEGMGVGTILFILPGLVIFIFSLFKKRRATIYDTMLLASFIFFFIVYRYIFSLPNVRYIYPMFAIGYCMAFTALSRINFPAKILRWIVLACLIASLPEMARKAELAASLVISFILFAALIFSFKYLEKEFLKFATIVILIALFALGSADKHYNKNEFRSYVKMVKFSGFWPDATKAWEWLNNSTSANNIAYIGRPVPFPLYGANFKNNVYYVSVNKIDPVKLHYFPNSYYSWGKDFLSVHKSFEQKGNYRWHADYSVWLGNLLRRKTDYLFVYSLHQTKEVEFPMEDAWATRHPEKFSPVFGNNTIHIYKILR